MNKYEEAKKVWNDRIEEAMADKSKAVDVLQSMEQTLWGLWMGRLDSTAMEFFVWLENKKTEFESYMREHNIGEGSLSAT